MAQRILMQSIAMTNKEILEADLLDILFENRNKAYRAYALRKNYNHRLLEALGISFGLAGILLIINSTRHEGNRNGFVIRPEVICALTEFAARARSSPGCEDSFLLAFHHGAPS